MDGHILKAKVLSPVLLDSQGGEEDEADCSSASQSGNHSGVGKTVGKQDRHGPCSLGTYILPGKTDNK